MSLAILCALLLALCIFAAHPVVEMAANDDFAYVFSAKRLAETGHILYCGWSSPMLGWQMGLAALAFKLFGFSFTAANAVVLGVALATAALLQRTYAWLGLTETNATFATLAVVLSPLFLPLSFSFMTDVPALFAIVVCLYACARAYASTEGASASAWLVFACMANALLGTVRQTAWLGVLVLAPSTMWILRRRGLRWPTLLATWLGCVVFVLACLHWFAQQPYVTRESAPALAGLNGSDLLDTVVAGLRNALGLALLLVPVTLAFTATLFRRGYRRALAVAGGVTLLCATLLLLRPHSYAVEVLQLPSVGLSGSYVTPSGTLQIPGIGHHAMQMGVRGRNVLTLVAFFAATAFLCLLPILRASRALTPPATARPSRSELLWMLAPTAAAYLLFLFQRATQAVYFDRYLLPLLLLLTFVAVRLYQDHLGGRMPLVSWASVALFALYGVLSTHDLFATERARLAATEELRRAGLPRQAFYGTFGFDGWTQVEQAGYISISGITLPPGAKRLGDVPARFKPCGYSMARLFPSIHARYALSDDAQGCAEQTMFAPVVYKLWLPPYHRTIYIRQVAP